MRFSPMAIATPSSTAFLIGSIFSQQARGHDAAIAPVASDFLLKNAPRSLHEGGPLDIVHAINSNTVKMDPASASTMAMDKWKPAALKPRLHEHGQRPGQPTTVADRQLQADSDINHYDTTNTFVGRCLSAEFRYYPQFFVLFQTGHPALASIEGCATFCQSVGVGHLGGHVGLSYDANVECDCLFEDHPDYISLPEGVTLDSQNFNGTGPIDQGNGQTELVCLPVIGPWVINFLDVAANFSVSSDDELVLNYEVGKGRKVETFLYKKDCTTNITDITINTTVSKTPTNLTYELLTVSYSVNKTAIGGSSVWNDTSTQIELCQVVQLKVEDHDMVISEDIREIDIDFDLDVDFTITNNTLGAATIEQGNGTTNLGSYLSAVRCSADAFDSDSSPLVPNAELFLCITSVSTDVGIASIDKMDIAQAEVYDLTVIVDGKPEFSSITSIEYVSFTEAKVSTFVPSNRFAFEAGASIAISGEAIMTLAVGPSGRKLQADVGAKEEAIFVLNVNLQPEIVAEEEEAMMNSAASAARKGCVMLGMVFASVYVMW